MGLWALFGRIRFLKAAGRRIHSASRYRGVQVIGARAGGCDAVRAIAGQRFLSHEIPTLPLGGCDATACGCSYQPFEDRRTGSRRDSHVISGVTYQYRTWDDRNKASQGRRRDD